MNITFSLIEKGNTEIAIYNVIGEKIKTIFSEDINEFNTRLINSNISDFESGEYMIIFQSPTIIQSMPVMIMK